MSVILVKMYVLNCASSAHLPTFLPVNDAKKFKTIDVFCALHITLFLNHTFRGLVHYCHGGKNVSMQADMVLKEPRCAHTDLKAAA